MVGFGLLLLAAHKGHRWLRDGDIFFLYLIWYPLGRFWVEMFRPDAWRMGSWATAQWFALGGMALGVLGLVLNHRGSRTQLEAGATSSGG
jgi:phosphatidylglycerol---prolipoprotein diacylglyceryl transferase